MGETVVIWQRQMEEAVESMMQAVSAKLEIGADHIADTPRRVVRTFEEYFDGVDKDPADVLRQGFEEKNFAALVTISEIQFTSLCMHHCLPILGKAHFAYLPDQRVVGLSKIPRMVDILAHRPQVQEKLTSEIARTFQDVVQPKGCGVVIDAVHFCMCIRGVKKLGAWTRTTALEGCFRQHPEVRAEFFSAIRPPESLW